MPNSIRRALFTLLILISIGGALAQTVDNVRIQQVEDQIYILYDLSNVDESQLLKIEVLISEDGGVNYHSSLKSVFGDVGVAVNSEPINDFEITFHHKSISHEKDILFASAMRTYNQYLQQG